MELQYHAPLYLIPRPGERIVEGGSPVPHASLWARLRIEPWGETCDLHRRMLALETGGAWRWEPADLSNRPLSLEPRNGLRPCRRPIPPEAGRSLERWVGAAVESLHRSVVSGLVSFPGEDADAFRRRVLATAAPGLASARGSAREVSRARNVLSGLARSIESVALPLRDAAILRLSLGWLVLPEPGVLDELTGPAVRGGKGTRQVARRNP